MMNKAFENMNELGKTWSDYSRRMSGEALRATSRSLDSMARYLDRLSEKLTAKDASQEATAEPEETHAETPAEPPTDAN